MYYVIPNTVRFEARRTVCIFLAHASSLLLGSFLTHLQCVDMVSMQLKSPKQCGLSYSHLMSQIVCQFMFGFTSLSF